MKNCPYCGAAGDFYFKIFSRTYNRCSGCDLIYKERQDSYDKVLTHYREDYFSGYSADQIEGGRNKLFSNILNFIEQKKDIGRLLDIGTGCGYFLVAAQKRGWSVKGIEPSKQSVEMAKYQNNLDVFHDTLMKYHSNDKFDVITFINVLDHLVEPWREIERAVDLLKPGGILYLRFPNGYLHTSLYQLASMFGLDDRIRKFLVFHQFSFTPKFINKLLEDSGFSEITVVNSPPTEGDPHNLFFAPTFAKYVKKAIYLAAQVIRLFSYYKIFLGTSVEVIAVKPKTACTVPSK